MYFNKINNINELKKKYKELVRKHHPDFGGSEDVLKQINSEYEALSKKLNTENHTEKDDKIFMEIVTKLTQYDNIEVELCGSWIWLSGDTKPIKEVLKGLKFHWASKKKKWYWRPEDYKSKGRKTKSMYYIRKTYGSETYKNGKKIKTIA